MLSSALFNEIRPEFFRVLVTGNAPLYVDVLDAIDLAMPHRSEGIPRSEAVDIIAELIRRRPDFLGEEDDGIGATPQEKANTLLNRLTGTGWLEEPVRSDYRRLLYFSANGELLLDTLRRMANPEIAQFTGKLRLVCDKLIQVGVTHEFSWDDLEACIDNTRQGLVELRQMQRSVQRFTRRQLETQTLRENLKVLYDEFSESIGHSCYRELVRAELPSKLVLARRELEQIAQSHSLIEGMQRQLLRRDSAVDATVASNRVQLGIEELIHALADVEPQAEQVDERTADFARRSFARFRYLQEVGSLRRQQMQAIFEWINEQFAGTRMIDLEAPESLPKILIHEVRLLRGLDSLLVPRLRRFLGEVEPNSDDVTDEERDACLAEMNRNLRDSLTVVRANQFVERLGLVAGQRIALEDLPLWTDDEIADLIACLLNSESNDANYHIDVPRVEADEDRSQLYDRAGYAMERVIIEKR
jgi:Family of unknown function (DUF5716)